ncbi:hypothetical protein J0A68_07770 [Algoriphagus sp. H41]|uniref:Addiction module component n=1 Tax=Algoriphagus oliviformis TaxID=2811231 RepID=A0ABS3C150_9BACT|nr:hypothetical protein [Algoriphagus oliviformis]MBN7810847.1 hypothetical protein [Algoriphagus oliviformis]
MPAVELKTQLIRLVEEIQEEDLLETLVRFLSQRNTPAGVLWDDLSESQKQEVLDAYEESEKEENLVEKTRLFRHLK